jgi:hypothetical protein
MTKIDEEDEDDAIDFDVPYRTATDPNNMSSLDQLTASIRMNSTPQQHQQQQQQQRISRPVTRHM